MDEKEIQEKTKQVVDNPYQSVINCFEKEYPCIGAKFFEYGALMALSSLVPDMRRPDGHVDKTNLHLMIVGNSGAGKSQLLRELQGIAHNPMWISRITMSDFGRCLVQGKRKTLIMNDMKRLLDEKGFVKIYEQAVDGRISDRTATHAYQGEVSISSVGAGVMGDLDKKKLFGGFLVRMLPLFLIYNVEEQKAVGERIAEGYVTDVNQALPREIIRRYYNILANIQRGGDKEHTPIKNYIISDEAKSMLLYTFKDMLEDIAGEDKYFFRDLKYGFSLAMNHSFSNYFNRKIEEGHIQVTADDAEVGSKLMRDAMVRRNALLMKPKAIKALSQMEVAHGLSRKTRQPITSNQ